MQVGYCIAFGYAKHARHRASSKRKADALEVRTLLAAHPRGRPTCMTIRR